MRTYFWLVFGALILEEAFLEAHMRFAVGSEGDGLEWDLLDG